MQKNEYNRQMARYLGVIGGGVGVFAFFYVGYIALIVGALAFSIGALFLMVLDS